MPSTLSNSYGHTHGGGYIPTSNGDVKERDDTYRNENGKDTGHVPYTVSSRSLMHGDIKGPLGEKMEQGGGSFEEHLRGNVLEGSYNMTEFNDQKPYNTNHRMAKNQLQSDYENDQYDSQNDNGYDSSNRHSTSSRDNRQHRYDQHNENEKKYQHNHSGMRVQDPSRRKAVAVEEEETVSEVREREGSNRVGRSEYDNHYLAQEKRGVKHVHGLSNSTIIKDTERQSSSNRRSEAEDHGNTLRRSEGEGQNGVYGRDEREGQSSSQKRGGTEEGISSNSDRQYNIDSDVSDRRQRYYDSHTQQSPTSSSSPPYPSSSSSTSTSTSTSCDSSSQYSDNVQNHHGRSLEGVYDHRSRPATSAHTALSIPSTHNTATATATAPSSSSRNSSNNNTPHLTDMSKWTGKINKEKDIVEQSRRNSGSSRDEEGEGEGEGGRIPPAPPSFAEDVNRMQVR